MENLLDKKGVGNGGGGVKEEKGGKSPFVGSGLLASVHKPASWEGREV